MVKKVNEEDRLLDVKKLLSKVDKAKYKFKGSSSYMTSDIIEDIFIIKSFVDLCIDKGRLDLVEDDKKLLDAIIPEIYTNRNYREKSAITRGIFDKRIELVIEKNITKIIEMINFYEKAYLLPGKKEKIDGEEAAGDNPDEEEESDEETELESSLEPEKEEESDEDIEIL